MEAKTIKDLVFNYKKIKNEISLIKKAVTLTKIFNHISGVKVKATYTVKIEYDLEKFMGKVSTRVISTMGNDLMKNWLELYPQSNHLFEYISLEDFLALPDWEESMESLECEIDTN